MELAQEKGASSLLTAFSVEEFGFALHKGSFRDALALPYGWSPYHAPIHCDCGDPFSMNHVVLTKQCSNNLYIRNTLY